MMRNALPVAADEWDGEAWAVAQARSVHAPALVARGDGALIFSNASATPFLAGSVIREPLRVRIAEAYGRDHSLVARVSLCGDDGQARRFDVTFLPLPDGKVLAIGREATIEANLIEALTESRSLFRDLALSAADFSFEADETGILTWVSPGGALGYSASELNGVRFAQAFGVDGNLLSARMPTKAAEVWCKGKSGIDCCIVLTLVAIASNRGVRGVAREVTALKLHERAAARTKRRDELIGAVVGAIRAQVEPRRMMLAAADALRGATESDRVEIKPANEDLKVCVGNAPSGGQGGLIVTTSYQARTNGSVSLIRNADGNPYGEEEQALLDAVVPHLGIAIAIAESLSAACCEPGSRKVSSC